jgi:hypothetical protein
MRETPVRILECPSPDKIGKLHQKHYYLASLSGYTTKFGRKVATNNLEVSDIFLHVQVTPDT